MKRHLTLGMLITTGVLCAVIPASASTWLYLSPGWTNLGSGRYHTCTPGAIIKDNRLGYRTYDNAWGESKQCITAWGIGSKYGPTIKITSGAVPSAMGTVAYPSIRFGSFYGDSDPVSGYPIRLDNLGRLTMRFACGGFAYGSWLCDLDAWVHPTSSTLAHGTFELVIIQRRPHDRYRSGQRVWVANIPYVENHWYTCQRLASGACNPDVPRWLLVSFTRVHSVRRAVNIPVWRFFRKCRLQHLVSRYNWLGDIAGGAELWSGGRGLEYWMSQVRK